MKIKNNPIDILLYVFEQNYSDTAKKIKSIQFAYIEEGFAVTVFNDEGIYIYISPVIKDEQPITFEVATELLAHELAHAIVGEKAEHGEEWEKTFDKLNQLYDEAAMKICEVKE